MTAFKSETKMDRLVLHAANFVEGLCGYEVDYETMKAPTDVPITMEDWVIGIQTGYMPEENKLVNNGRKHWNYSKQYLELGRLYIFGYTGNYTDYAELTGQTVRRVPWALKKDDR